MNKIYLQCLIFLIYLCFVGNLYAKDEGVDIHGFISQGYMKTTGNNYIADSIDGTFQFNEMGINFAHRPIENLFIGMQFFARDFGSIGNDDIVLDWAFADYRVNDWLGIRGGKIKNPMGLYNETRDVDVLRTSIMLPDSVYQENWRETLNSIQGVGLYGSINTNSFGTLKYQVYAGTNNIVSDGGMALFLAMGNFDIYNVEIDSILSFSLVWAEPFGYAKFSGTGYFTDVLVNGVSTPDFTPGGLSMPGLDVIFALDDIEIYVFSFEFTWDYFIFSYEYFLSHSKIDIHSGALQLIDRDSDPLGWYASLTYRLNDVFVIGYSYGEYYPEETNRHGSNPEIGERPNFRHWDKKSVFSLKCDINSNWIFKVEAQYIDGDALAPEEINKYRETDDWARYWWLYAVKLSYNF